MDEDILAKYGGDFHKNVNIWDLFNLKGKVAIVSGGAGIYGFVISTALAEAGATVVIASRDVSKCEAKAAELRGEGFSAVGMPLDMTSDESIFALRDAVVERFGRMDIAFNNSAGRAVGGAEEQAKAGWKHGKAAMDQMTRAMWEGAMTVNASGFFICCQVFAEEMRAKGTKGSIINTSSIYGNVAPDFSIYGSTGMTSPPDYAYAKAGIINFTRFMASYYGRFGIRVNCISPGGYYTSQPAEFLRNYEKRTMLGRMAGWNDLKGAALFLASDASLYVTGHNLLVEGGWCAW